VRLAFADGWFGKRGSRLYFYEYREWVPFANRNGLATAAKKPGDDAELLLRMRLELPKRRLLTTRRNMLKLGLSFFAPLAHTSGAAKKIPPIFVDQFNEGVLDASKWSIATYGSPDSKPGINVGSYVTEAIDLSTGLLRIAVNQEKEGGVVYSTGGAIISKDRFGYGDYEFEMRMSSDSPTPEGAGGARSGAISSAFIYNNRSESEIDLEFLGDIDSMWVTSWRNTDLSSSPTGAMKSSARLPNRDLAKQFHRYTLSWEEGIVRVYIDGYLAIELTEHVPSVPAKIVLQHRGTHSPKWGGFARPGTTRYAYFKTVKFTPWEGK